MRAADTKRRQRAQARRASGFGSIALRLSCSPHVLAALGVLSTAGVAGAAQPGTVLPSGTVPVLKNVQSGVGSITTTPTATGNLMTINQNQRAAIIQWNQFNIGRGSEVRFVQPDAGARALNRIFDADPSIIQGKLNANGQVYLLNRNGILFDRGAQVNVGALFASTLNVTDTDFTNGFPGGAQDGGANPFVRFDLFKDENGNPLPSGPILVNVHGPSKDAGGNDVPAANIASASQGAIVLIAPAIENRGVITSPDGQVVLAAGRTAYLWQRNTESTGDPKAGSVRGLMVEITAGEDDLNISTLVANGVVNSGTLQADRGNVSIAALAINQKGIVSAGSSVVSNGSVWLTARSIQDAPNVTTLPDNDTVRTIDRLGKVEFGANSFTGTPLLVDSGRLSESDGYANFQASTVRADNTTATFSRDFRSWVHVVGNTIHNQGTIEALGGTIDLLALGFSDPITAAFRPPRILLDASSRLSAAGNWVEKAMQDNMIDIARLTSNDLKDAPLQRSGPLLGSAVTVDARAGSPLFSVQPYIDNRQNTVQEKATVGGEIRMEAREGDVIIRSGSIVDVSGGGIHYADGTYTTTRLLGEDGKVYDISTASPLRNYVGTTDDITSRTYFKAGPMGWNLTENFANRFENTPTVESAYVQGASGGALSIVAPTIVVQGDLRGGVTLGRYQVGETNAALLPTAASLTIGNPSGVSGGLPNFGIDRITFGTAPSLPSGFTIDTTLATDVTGAVLPSNQFVMRWPQEELFAYWGFGSLALYANQSVEVPAGSVLELAPGAALTARTANFDATIAIDGSIVAPSGRVSLNSPTVHIGGRVDVSGTVTAGADASTGLPNAGGFTARAASSLRDYVAVNLGALLDDMATAPLHSPQAVSAPAFSSGGGTVAISASNVELDASAGIAAMGGFRLHADRSIAPGNGGAITLSSSVGATNPGDSAGVMKLDGTLQGYSLGKGAELQMQSRSFTVSDQIGDAALASGRETGDLILAPSFFRNGGFTRYTLVGLAGMQIESGTAIEPAAQGMHIAVASLGPMPNRATETLVPQPAVDASRRARIVRGTGADAVGIEFDVREKLPGERSPVSLAFRLSPTNAFADVQSLRLGVDARIETDPLAAVSFTMSSSAGVPAGLGIDLLGSVLAPGGSISAALTYPQLEKGAPTSLFDPNDPDADRESGLLRVGSTAMLSTHGAFLEQTTGGKRFGSVREADGSVVQRERVFGRVIDGGTIALSATRGRVVTEPGATLDVSAASATIDVPSGVAPAEASLYVPQPIWSDAGSVSVSSTEASRIEGKVLGASAGAGDGGAFTLTFGRRPLGGDPEFLRDELNHRVVVSARAPDDDRRADASAAFVTSRVSSDVFAGLAKVKLQSDHSVELVGTLDLNAANAFTIDAPIIDVKGAPNVGTAPATTLTAGHVTIANATGTPFVAKPDPTVPVPLVPTSVGRGAFFVNARLVDLMGSVTIDGLARGTDAVTGAAIPSLVIDSATDVRLTGLPVQTLGAASGTQRADALAGALSSAGNIELRAQQVYPTTLSAFTIASRDVAPGPGGALVASPGGTLRIAQAPGVPQPVLSAGGQLTLEGGAVVQAGTVRAPLGGVALSGRDVTFEAGSLTSVAMDGATVPMGETLNGRTWYYDLLTASTPGTYVEGRALVLTAPGEKRITATGETVRVQPGATIDVSGGGDVQAFEFVPGPGGSRDVLQSSASNATWAILPSLRLSDAPLDTHLAARAGKTLTADGARYDTIYVSGVAGLADGVYPLLDAHYALLPGAYQVTADPTAAKDLPTGRTGTLLDGTPVVSAWRGIAGTDVREARTSGYRIRSGTEARRHSQFDVSNGEFFANQALAADRPVPRLPQDAGTLNFLPTASLVLQGELKASPAAGGASAQVNISADSIRVVDRVEAQAEPAANGGGSQVVTLGADALNRLEGSLLLGGIREAGAITATAREVVLANRDVDQGGVPLALGEVILTARDRVAVETGAVVEASGSADGNATIVTSNDRGALLRVSSGGQMRVERGSSVDSSGGVLEVSGTVRGKSVLFDATRTTRFDGVLDQSVPQADGSVARIPGSAFSVSAGSVALGETVGFLPGGTAPSGLVMNTEQLASLAEVENLTLRSYSGIDFVGRMTLGSATMQTLILDAAELRGFAVADLGADPVPADARIVARSVTLRNSGAASPAVVPDGNGSLSISAQRLTLAEGEKVVRGFRQIDMNLADVLVQTGEGSTTLAGDTRISTPRITAASGAAQTVAAANREGTTDFDLTITSQADAGAAASAGSDAASLGGRWVFVGKSVSFGSVLDAPAGEVRLEASGSDSADAVSIKSGAAISVAGAARAFSDATAYASAGQVRLKSAAGDVRIEEGATVDVSAPAGGGDAGRFEAGASGGIIGIEGTLVGVAPHGTSGAVSLDAATFEDFSGMNERLNAGGFGASRTFRQRTGDIAVAAGLTIDARQISLTADGGSIEVSGTLNAASPSGAGRVSLYAGENLHLRSGSMVSARGMATGTQAADPYSHGGDVELVVERGRLEFGSGATIDVSAGAKGDAGRATFVAARPDTASILPMELHGTVVAAPGLGGGEAKIVARGDRSYAMTNITNTTTASFTGTNKVWSDYKSFMDGAGALRTNFLDTLTIVGAEADAFSVRAGITIESASGTAPTPLTLGSAWDLTNQNWNQGGVPGQLTLRATGDLNINNALGLPTDSLPLTQSWSLRLIGGAAPGGPTTALAPLKALTAANAGDVVVRDDGGTAIGKVRTGTGDIEILAGRDVRIGTVLTTNNRGDRAVVYTAGIPDVPSSVDATQRYTSGGGDITISAQRDVTGAMSFTPVVDAEGNPVDPLGKQGQYVSDWLRRTSLPPVSQSLDRLTAVPGGWWTYRANFRHNVGSFGGGSVAVSAGQDITNLGAAVPTTGRANDEVNPSFTAGTLRALPTDESGNPVLEVRGGGDLTLSAGRNVLGGEFVVGQGTGTIRAGGDVGSRSVPLNLFLMGQGSDPARSGATIRVEALGDAIVQSISNPTILASSQQAARAGLNPALPTVGFGLNRDAFFTYADNSAAAVTSVTGDVALGRYITVKPTGTNPTLSSTEWSSVAPPQLSLVSLSGSVEQLISVYDALSRPITLFPSEQAALTVLAHESVRNLNVSALNVTPEALPLWYQPAATAFANVSYRLAGKPAELAGTTVATSVERLFQSSLPRLAGAEDGAGTRFAVEAASGDVTSATLTLPARGAVRAGRDIVSSILNLQNVSDADTSIVAAGRDIVQDPFRYRGDPSNQLVVAFAGPGIGMVQSGRNIDLGTSLGIVADGNTRNASLPTTQSARLIVLAGVRGEVKVGTVDALMSVTKLFGLTGDGPSAALGREAGVEISAVDAAEAATLDALQSKFEALAVEGSTKAIRDAAAAALDAVSSVRRAVSEGGPAGMLASLVSGLRGLRDVDTKDGAAVTAVAADAAKSFAAAAFADNAPSPGSIDLFNTKIQTTGGSGIDLVAPGYDGSGGPAGQINAGLPSGSQGNVGITTQTGGAIRAYLSGDFNVNQSKVLTAQGGDILMYSSDGGIDAGRGALTSRSSSPPRRVPLYGKDELGNTVLLGYVFLPPIDVTGSGIRTVTSDPDGPGPLAAPPAGSIFLFAPRGTINAGEAGIASAGDVTIRANQVLNATAISAAGSSSGVPRVDTSGIGSLSVAPTPTANRGTDDPTRSIAQTSSNAGEAPMRLSIIVVEVLGFGTEAEDDPKRKR